MIISVPDLCILFTFTVIIQYVCQKVHVYATDGSCISRWPVFRACIGMLLSIHIIFDTLTQRIYLVTILY